MAGLLHARTADIRGITRRVVERDGPEPFGAYLFGSEQLGAELGRALERQVFLESFGNTPDLLVREYGPYEASSVFLCIIDHMRAQPAGVMRVILPSSRGFKSLSDIESVWGVAADQVLKRTGLELAADAVWDIATLAVAPEYRGRAARGLVSMGLYQTLTLAARRCGVEWFVAILDLPVFRMLRWRLRMIFAGYEGLRPLPYLGSVASIPAWCNVPDAERRLATVDPDLHRVLVQGVGLEPALRPIDLAAAVESGRLGRRAAAG